MPGRAHRMASWITLAVWPMETTLPSTRAGRPVAVPARGRGAPLAYRPPVRSPVPLIRPARPTRPIGADRNMERHIWTAVAVWGQAPRGEALWSRTIRRRGLPHRVAGPTSLAPGDQPRATRPWYSRPTGLPASTPRRRISPPPGRSPPHSRRSRLLSGHLASPETSASHPGQPSGRGPCRPDGAWYKASTCHTAPGFQLVSARRMRLVHRPPPLPRSCHHQRSPWRYRRYLPFHPSSPFPIQSPAIR